MAKDLFDTAFRDGYVDFNSEHISYDNSCDWNLNKNKGEKMNQLVNVYGTTEVWNKNGLLEEVYDGFGYKDNDGNITWYEGYNPPKDDKFHSTLIIPYGGGKDISELR